MSYLASHSLLASAGLSSVDYGVIGVYLCLVLLIGASCKRAETSTAGYLLGGRSMRWWLVGVSYMVTFLSTVSMVGVPGEAFKNGLTSALWPMLGLSLSIGLFFVFIRFYFQRATFTPFEYLERRFGSATRCVTAAIYMLARGLYLGTVLFASAKVFEGLSGWPFYQTIFVVGGMTGLYTFLGGMRAIVWIDLLQFCVLMFGLGTIVYLATRLTSGSALDVLYFAHEHDHLFPDLKRPEFYSLNPYVRLTLWTILLRAFGDHLFYKSADQILIQRMLATSSYCHAFRCALLGSALAALMVWALYYVGLCIYQYYAQLPEAERPAPDLALFAFISTHVPTPLAGLVAAAMLATIMSTVDSGLNSLATVATKDFYLRYWRPAASEAAQIRVSRCFTAFWGVVVVAFTFVITSFSESVEGTVMEAAGVWMALLLVLGPVFLLGVLSRRARQGHALTALTVGSLLTLVMIVWYYATKTQGIEANFHLVAVVPFLGALTAAFLTSRFSQRATPQALGDLTLFTLGKLSPSLSSPNEGEL